jgi:hypothetical protein
MGTAWAFPGDPLDPLDLCPVCRGVWVENATRPSIQARIPKRRCAGAMPPTTFFWARWTTLPASSVAFLGAAAAAAGVPLPPLQPPPIEPLHSLPPLPTPAGTTTRRTRTTYLCVHQRGRSVGSHQGELLPVFSKPLAFFVIFDIFYIQHIFVIFDIFYILVIYYIFHIFVIFRIFSTSDIFSIFVIFDILLIFDIYITKSKYYIYMTHLNKCCIFCIFDIFVILFQHWDKGQPCAV